MNFIAQFGSDRVEKRLDLGQFPFNDDFDAAVREITDVTRNGSRPSQTFGREAKTDPLDST